MNTKQKQSETAGFAAWNHKLWCKSHQSQSVKDCNCFETAAAAPEGAWFSLEAIEAQCEVERERDELLAALKALLENTEYNMTEEQSFDHAMDAHDQDQCVLCGARAAIAAVEGSNQ